MSEAFAFLAFGLAMIWRNGNDNGNGPGIAMVGILGFECRQVRLGVRFVCMYVARFSHATVILQ